MSTRNFDSRVIIERLQNKNYAKNIYDARARGQPILRNPQTTNGNASMMTLYQNGSQTNYEKGLLGGAYTANLGGIYGVPVSISPITNTVPDSPSITSITSGNQQLTVFFTAPLNTGGPDVIITDYEYSINGGSTYISIASVGSPFIITGLTNGTSYTVILRAINYLGPSSPSTGVSETPATIPSAPTSLSVLEEFEQLTVSFTAGSNGGSVITKYQYSLDNGASYYDAAQLSSPIVIIDLVTGVTYSIKIRAVNAIGNGTASATVSGTPISAPGAPTLNFGLEGDGEVYLYFTAGSGTVSNYEYTLDSGSSWTPLSPADTSQPVLIPSLTNGVSTTIALRAVNGAGTSSSSNSITLTPVAASIQAASLYYDPNDSSSYSGSGQSINNIGSYGSFTGTLSAGVDYIIATSTERYIFNFSGTDYISFNQYNFGTGFTISAWVYPFSKYSINGLLANVGANQAPSGFKVGWNNWNTTNWTMLYEGGNGSTGNAQASVNNTVVSDTWQHLTYIIDKTNQHVLFIRNGVPVNTASYSNNQIVENIGTNNSNFRIGTFTDGSYGMKAELGYMKVYSSMLTLGDIKAEYDATKSEFGL